MASRAYENTAKDKSYQNHSNGQINSSYQNNRTTPTHAQQRNQSYDFNEAANEEIKKLEKKVQDLTYEGLEKERAIRLLKDENQKLKDHGSKGSEVDSFNKEIRALKEENLKLKRENEDFTYKN